MQNEISEDLELSKLALAKLTEEMTSIEAKDYIIELKRNRLYNWIGELDRLTKHTMTKIIKISELEEKAYEVYLQDMGVRVPDEWMGFMNTSSDLTSKMKLYEMMSKES
ncbi:hypothetical protein C5167_032057 [Papaver somniferum]|uniref:Uncharacterized protein n=1 Tax=Papaver somniferum TaxID=3469 RepID=A0A4Y7K8W6_PAPSO|nr:hypothetical protein C5167_032057 [Papaver somniferum]